MGTERMTNIDCDVCEEPLDDRDIVRGNYVCWKCGWKKEVPKVRTYKIDEIDEMLENYLNDLNYPVD